MEGTVFLFLDCCRCGTMIVGYLVAMEVMSYRIPRRRYVSLALA
jgi:hypothetical protein